MSLWTLGQQLSWSRQLWKQDRVNQSMMLTQWIIANTNTHTLKKTKTSVDEVFQ